MTRRWPITAALALVAGVVAPGATAQDGTTAKAEYEALNKEFRTAQRAFFDKQRAAHAEGGMAALQRVQREADPAPDFIPKFQDAAARYAATPAAVPFLTWLVTSGAAADPDAGADALACLVVDHAKSAEIADAVVALRYSRVDGAEIDGALAEILETSPHDGVRAAALFVRGLRVLADESAGETDREAAFADLTKVIELAPKADIAAEAEGNLFEAKHLQVGMEAPDIVGEDLDGVEFKLSDYRGKVVMLDFWGDW